MRAERDYGRRFVGPRGVTYRRQVVFEMGLRVVFFLAYQVPAVEYLYV